MLQRGPNFRTQGVTGGPRGAEWTILESFKQLSLLIYLRLTIKCVGEGGGGAGDGGGIF